MSLADKIDNFLKELPSFADDDEVDTALCNTRGELERLAGLVRDKTQGTGQDDPTELPHHPV